MRPYHHSSKDGFVQSLSILELLYQQHIYTPHRRQISHAPSAYFQSSLNCILPQTNIDPDSQFCTIPQTNISANHLATRPKCAPPVTQSLSTCKRAESLPRRVSNSTPTQPLTRPDLCSDNSCATAQFVCCSSGQHRPWAPPLSRLDRQGRAEPDICSTVPSQRPALSR
jgi:hypothetical protein